MLTLGTRPSGLRGGREVQPCARFLMKGTWWPRERPEFKVQSLNPTMGKELGMGHPQERAMGEGTGSWGGATQSVTTALLSGRRRYGQHGE